MKSFGRAILAPFNYFIDFLAPKYCLVCEDLLNTENQIEKLTFICKSCFYLLDAAPQSDEILNRMFEHFHPDDISITNAYALYKIHEKNFIEIIHNLKYYKLWKIGYEFGLLLGEKIVKNSDVQYDAVVAVPIHIAKIRERGYNQSDYIAKGVCEILNVANFSKFVVRQRYTTSQTLLNSQERKRNIEGAYKIDKKASYIFENKRILIVDDVFTTGSTINHLGNVLLNHGAKQVDCATLGVA